MYDPKMDEKDATVHFQDHQFDKDMRRSYKATDTAHIRRQGSQIDDQSCNRPSATNMINEMFEADSKWLAKMCQEELKQRKLPKS